MSLLLASLVVLTLALVATVIFGLKGVPVEKEAKIKVNKIEPADASGQYDGEIEKLSAKLRKAKEDYQRIEEELALAKKNEAAAQEELQKLKSWLEKEKGRDEANKKEMNELREKLLKKDEEYEKEFSLNLNLKKELNAYREAAENLKAQNNDQAASLRLKEAQLKAYREELGNLTRQAAELKKKDEDSQWVSKKEHDELKLKLKETEDGRKNQTE
jgi:hypothetical protein